MKSTSVTNLKASLSAFLSYVKGGSQVVITEHDIPIAVIYPYDVQKENNEENYAALIRAGIISAPQKSKRKRKNLIKPLEIKDKQDRIMKALLSERESGW